MFVSDRYAQVNPPRRPLPAFSGQPSARRARLSAF